MSGIDSMQTAEELIKANSKFVYFILHKYFGDLAYDEDIQQIGFLGLWKAILQHEPEKGELTTLASRIIYNEVAMELRKRSRRNRVPMVSLDTPIQENFNFYADTIEDLKALESIEGILLVDAINQSLKLLTKREKDVIELSLRGMTQTEIAKCLGISQSYVSRLKQQIRKKVKPFVDGDSV